VGRAGQERELGGWQRHQIARYAAAKETEQLDDVPGNTTSASPIISSVGTCNPASRSAR
jgi:hypothetical protein